MYILEIYDPNLDFIDDYEYDGNSYINPIIAMNVLIAWILSKRYILNLYIHRYFCVPNKRAGIYKREWNKGHTLGKSENLSSKLLIMPAPLFGTLP